MVFRSSANSWPSTGKKWHTNNSNALELPSRAAKVRLPFCSSFDSLRPFNFDPTFSRSLTPCLLLNPFRFLLSGLLVLGLERAGSVKSGPKRKSRHALPTIFLGRGWFLH